MADSTDRLNTQTEACLQKDPPDKLAPALVDGFSLVLLERGPDRDRVVKAIQALADNPAAAFGECPVVLRRNLTLTDALFGQFELICSDSISVFLRDDVVRCADPNYLLNLYGQLRTGEEFSPVTVHLTSIPDDENGRRFLLQFFGQFLGVETTHTVARKKARIMAQWGARLGIAIEFPESTT